MLIHNLLKPSREFRHAACWVKELEVPNRYIVNICEAIETYYSTQEDTMLLPIKTIQVNPVDLEDGLIIKK